MNYGGRIELLFYGLIDKELRFGDIILKPSLEPLKATFPSLLFGSSPAGGMNRPSENAYLLHREPLKVKAEIVVEAENESTARDLIRNKFVHSLIGLFFFQEDTLLFQGLQGLFHKDISGGLEVTNL